MKWTFQHFELDAGEFQLRRRSRPVKIERIPLELLILLVERAGTLVSREEICARLWRSSVHVDVQSGVNTAVRKVRAALKDLPSRPVFLETVAGKGYRFIQPSRTGALDPAGPVKIAVLPFQNLSGDPEQEYFADGLTEETIAALGTISPSRILAFARTSVMGYKGTLKPAGRIGEELGATYLVESSVRRDRERIRITSRLIRAEDQVQIWNATYDRSPEDSLDFQNEVAQVLASRIGAEFSSIAVHHVARRTGHDPDAHDLYLRGRHYLNQRAPDSLRRAMEFFEQAIQKDPSYALAHSAVAEALVLQTLIIGFNALDQWNRVRLATDTALRLNPGLAEAHAANGITSFFLGWDWPAAESSFQRAIDLNSNYAVAHQFYGHLLSNWQRHDEALVEIRKAREIDPLSPVMHTFAGATFIAAKQYEEAVGPLQQALSIDPDFFPTHSVLGLWYQFTGKPDKAIEEFRNAYRLSGGHLLQLANQGYVLGRIGRCDDARQIVATMNQVSQSRFVPPYAFALVYAALDDDRATFRWLEKAYAARDIGLVFLPCDSRWDSLRSDPRFQKLLRRCGFPLQAT